MNLTTEVIRADAHNQGGACDEPNTTAVALRAMERIIA